MKSVLAAWPWLVGLWAAELALGFASGATVRGQVAAALGEFAIPDDHRMYAVAELVGEHPQTLVAIVLAIAASGLLATLAWSVLAPGVIARLGRGPLGAAELGGVWLGSLPGSIATSAWHLVLRAGLGFALVGTVASLPSGVALAIAAVTILVATAALDISRTQVVLHGAAGASIRTALWGYLHAIKRPRLLATIATLQLLQWGCAIAGLAIAVRSGGESIAWARVGALVGTAIGLLRMHHVACAGSMPTPPRAES